LQQQGEKPSESDLLKISQETEALHRELDEINQSRTNGKFILEADAGYIPTGQEHLNSLLDECYCRVYEVIDRMLAEK
jgi:hypothetical protein